MLCPHIASWLKTGASALSSEIKLDDGRHIELECWHIDDSDLIQTRIKDISKQAQKQARLELLESAIDQSWESVLVTDADFIAPGPRFVFCNDGFERLTGYSPSEVLGKTPRILQGPLTDRVVLHRLKQNLLAGSDFHGEAINYKKDGTPFWLEWRISAVRDRGGKIINYISFQRDITALKEAQQKNSELISTLAHEIRAPLTSIMGAFSLLKNNVDHAMTQELLGIGLDSTSMLLRLISDILELEHVESGKFELKLAPCSVRDLFNSVERVLQNYCPEKELQLKLELEQDFDILIDADRIRQVLVNLISNAMKFSPPGGTVTVSAVLSSGNSARFAVKDSGPGIRKENLSKLFSKFQRISPEDGKIREGSGLGLTIAKSFVEAHGGRVGVESMLGHGATFWFILRGVTQRKTVPQKIPVPGSLLVIGTNELFAAFVKMRITNRGYLVNRISSIDEVDSALEKFTPQVCLLNSDAGAEKELADKIEKLGLSIPTIIVSGGCAGSSSLVTSLSDAVLSPIQFVDLLEQSLREGMEPQCGCGT
jgi:PAS domain S-box-containing protein